MVIAVSDDPFALQAADARRWCPAEDLRIVRRHWWSRGRLQQKWKVNKYHASGYVLGYDYEWRDVDCVKVDRDGRDISGTTEW